MKWLIHDTWSQLTNDSQTTGSSFTPCPFWEWTIIAASKYQYHIGWEISPFVQQKLRDFFWQCWHVMTSGIGTGGLKREVRSNIHHKRARLKGGRLTSPVRSSKKQVSTHFVPFFVLQIYGRVNKRSGMRLFGEKCSFMPRGNVQTVCWERHSTQFPSQKKNSCPKIHEEIHVSKSPSSGPHFLGHRLLGDQGMNTNQKRCWWKYQTHPPGTQPT